MRDWLAPSAELKVENRLKMCFIRGLIDGILFGMYNQMRFCRLQVESADFVCFSLFCHPPPRPGFLFKHGLFVCLFCFVSFRLFPVLGFFFVFCLFVSKSSCALSSTFTKTKANLHHTKVE